MARRHRWSRFPRDRRIGAAVLLGLAGYVGTVYVAVVVGGGAVLGRSGSPGLALSVVATAVVALGFEPVQARVDRAARIRLSGAVAPPYELLTRFPGTVTGGYSAHEIPARMAKVLAEGTGAVWAQVWLVLNGQLVLAASWPAAATSVSSPPVPVQGARDATGRALRALPVWDEGDLLGVLRLEEQDPLTPVEERLFAGLAAQAALVLRLTRLRAELSQRVAELDARAGELRASRERLLETQDDERRRLERDIHDGAQQHLVALTVNLRLARTLLARSPERAKPVLAAQGSAARAAIATLTELSRGIYPRILARDGLVPALDAAADTSPLAVTVTSDVPVRPTPEVEAALYFCCLEALQNTAKHSGASRATLDVRLGEDGMLRARMEDDGAGFDPATASAGLGLANMRDRIEAVGGTLTITAVASGGTRVEARVPVAVVPAAVVPAPRPG